MTVPEPKQPKSGLKVTVVDLSKPDAEIVPQIREAFKNGGFCYVINHGVSPEMLKKTFKVGSDFFKLPAEERLSVKAGVNGNFRGYTGLGDESLDYGGGTKPDTKECFYFTSQFEPGSEEGRKLDWGRNHNVWPKAMPELKEVITSYHAACCNVGWQMLRLLAKAMDLPEDTFSREYAHPHVYGRVNHYSKTKSAPQEGLFAAGAHTDYGVTTVLATDSEPGLEVFQDGQWYPCPTMENAFIILIGDVMERWTNGKYPGTLHRVINSTGNERTSIAVWFDCDLETKLAPLPQFLAPGEQSKYAVTSYRTHLTDLFYKTFPSWREGMEVVGEA